MKTIIIDSERQKIYAYNLIKEMPLDGTCEVITKKVDKKLTAKQRALWFIWCRDVARSGLGSHDTVDAVHDAAKWQFVRRILLRDSEIFGMIYEKFMEAIEGAALYSEFCKEFSKDYISTEKLNRYQRAESLTEFQRYWLDKGVNLANPDDYGRGLLKQKPEKCA